MRRAACALACRVRSRPLDLPLHGRILLTIAHPAVHYRYGIDDGRYHELLETMAQQALASGSPNNNPLIPSAEEIVTLYKSVYQ